MENVCRLCLQYQNNMNDISCKSEKSTRLRRKIKDHCSIELSEDDPLPKLICDECKIKLIITQEFRDQCKESDYLLRMYYKMPIPTTRCTPTEAVKNTTARTDVDSSTREPQNEVLLPVKEEAFFAEAIPPVAEEMETNGTIDTDRTEEYIIMDIKEIALPSIKKERPPTETVPAATENLESNETSVTSRSKRSVPVNGPRKEIETIFLPIKEEKLVREETAASVPSFLDSKGKKITIKTLLARRVREVMSKNKYTCDVCKKMHSSKGALTRDVLMHVEEEKVTCATCDKSFYDKEKLIQHINKHGDGADFKCKVCFLPFKDEGKLDRHSRIHGKRPTRPLITNRPFLCDICSKTFAQKSSLTYHLKVHSNNWPYSCKYCNKGFLVPNQLKYHEKIHTTDKRFACHLCSAAFASHTSIIHHIKTHTGETNYYCETCGKSFMRLQTLKEHKFKHTGEKPFRCKLCGSIYRHSGSLYFHMRKCKLQYARDNAVTIDNEPFIEKNLKAGKLSS